jgi:ferric-dicitrate binding protein FerR (iron transport regulator)
MRTASLVAGRAAGLSDAERLRLEEHLETCASCRADAAALDAMARVVLSNRHVLSDRALRRAVDGAITRGQAAPAAAVSASRRGWVLGLAGVGAAAVAAAVLSSSWRGGGSLGIPPRTGEAPNVATSAPARNTNPAAVPTPSVSPPAAAPVAHVVSGRLASATHTLDAGATVPAGEPLRASEASEVALAHAHVVLAPESAIAWQPAQATVRLDAGSLVASVDPGPKQPFRVATASFQVEVVGTRFEVTPKSVRVFQGVVFIRDPRGKPLVEALGPGGHWQVAPSGGQAADVDATDAAHVLASARRLVADSDVAGARRELARARRLELTRAERAEADTLDAEVQLVSGHEAAAAKLYERVGERYRDLPAGESALYAAAKAWTRGGNAGKARIAAKRYLQRYPDGRFVTEATALSKPPAAP